MYTCEVYSVRSLLFRPSSVERPVVDPDAIGAAGATLHNAADSTGAPRIPHTCKKTLHRRNRLAETVREMHIASLP